MRSRMQRALVRLTQDIYAEDVHVVLELLQNADDNQYQSGTVPALAFTFRSDGVLVGNNELGFDEANIRSLCDVAFSTKTQDKQSAGAASHVRIGEKGIGFKSVFSISDCPHIISGGFQIYFDAHHPRYGSFQCFFSELYFIHNLLEP